MGLGQLGRPASSEQKALRTGRRLSSLWWVIISASLLPASACAANKSAGGSSPGSHGPFSLVAGTSSVVEGRAVDEVGATQGGPVIEMHSDQIEVHLDLGSEQIMGIIVHLLLGQPVG